MDPYALIAQYPNAGQAFSDAFQQGMQKNAINALMQNPNDPKALAMYGQYDPKGALEYKLEQQKTQSTLSAEQTKQWHDYAGRLAKWADTPEKWDQAVDYMVAQGHTEAAQLKGKFSPQLRQSFMALGGQADDANAGQPKYFNLAPGGSVVSVDPTTGAVNTVVQPNDGSQMSGSPAPAPSGGTDLRAEAIKAIQAGADPQKVLQRMVQLQGGQAATPSATFPGPH